VSRRVHAPPRTLTATYESESDYDNQFSNNMFTCDWIKRGKVNALHLSTVPRPRYNGGRGRHIYRWITVNTLITLASILIKYRGKQHILTARQLASLVPRQSLLSGRTPALITGTRVAKRGFWSLHTDSLPSNVWRTICYWRHRGSHVWMIQIRSNDHWDSFHIKQTFK